ncbi:MAG: nitroreductase family protein [Bacteroidales bacterium]
MELKHAIEKRTSIRSFSDEKVPVEDLKELVRRAGLAPSVNNYQPWDFIAITNKDTLENLAIIISEKYKDFPFKKSDVTTNVKKQVEWYSTFFTGAPALIAVVLKEYESVLERGTEISHEEINKMRNYPDIQSTGACIQNLLLSAVDMGYGGCWLSGPMIARAEIEEILEIQKPSILLSFVAIGKPSKEFKPKSKEDLGEKMRIID